jgi:hypothetical protein
MLLVVPAPFVSLLIGLVLIGVGIRVPTCSG